MKHIYATLALVTVSVSGCIPDRISGDPANFVMNDRGRLAAPNAQSNVEIRVFWDNGAPLWFLRERNGVSCQLENEFGSASFVAPGAVIVPTWGTDTPTTTVTCQVEGGREVRDELGRCTFRGLSDAPGASEERGRCTFFDMSLIYE